MQEYTEGEFSVMELDEREFSAGGSFGDHNINVDGLLVLGGIVIVFTIIIIIIIIIIICF